MPSRKRRSVLASSATLLTGSLIASSGTVRADETSDGDLELTVNADDSTHVNLGNTSFIISVTNHGSDSVSVPVTLEVAHFDEELETLELAGHDSASTYQSFDPRSLGPGEHDWTVTAGDETETGTLVVESDDDYEDRDEGFYLAVHGWNPDDGEEVVVHVEDAHDTINPGFDMTALNYRYDAVETELTFEIDDETEEIPLKFDPRESKYVFTEEELGVGRYEWTATLGEETETGRIRIVPEDADEC
ncbi:hypothetical protein [Natronococcus wangiae]|uniref:hypothetical protein n=1 Tax=Natronococcus wangiae TaxID=3068275 RepID=UPI0027402D5E|nr:hypothetical protein [Natronococcus sp. AD5]